MEALQKHYYTINDVYNLPEGERAELIDGDMYLMAPPNTIHQEILGSLHATIFNYIKSKGGGPCKVYPAPFAVFLNNDNITYVEPDISVICDKSKIDSKGCNGAPDWIIEITSPGNPSHDYITKLAKYKAAGVREYWIVNPLSKSIYVYYFSENQFITTPYSFNDKIKVNIYEDLFIDFNDIEGVH